MYRNNDIDYLKFLGKKKIYIFGAGKKGRTICFKLKKMNYTVLGYIDNDEKKQGQRLDEVHIISVEDFKEYMDKETIIIIASMHEKQIRTQLLEAGIYHFISDSQIDFGGGEEYYDEMYFEWQKSMGEFGAKIKKRLFEPYIPNDAVLMEFGAGGGYLLDALQAKEKLGIEINDMARKQAEEMGIRSVKRICECPDNYADVIISNSALEHVENPLEVLRELHGKLKDNGKIVFYVPNESCDTEYRRSDVNNHLYTWNCLNIGNLFKTAGYFVYSVQKVKEVWPKDYMKIEQEVSEELFDALAEIGGHALHENRCLIVAYK